MLIRRLYGWELESVNNLYISLENQKLDTSEQVKLLWKSQNSGTFSVKSYYNIIEQPRSESITYLWHNSILPRVNSFVQEVWRGQIMTFDNVKKRGLHMVNKRYLLSGRDYRSPYASYRAV